MLNYQRVKFWDGWKHDDFKCRSLVNPILLIDDLVTSLFSLVISSYVLVTSPEEKAGKIICAMVKSRVAFSYWGMVINAFS